MAEDDMADSRLCSGAPDSSAVYLREIEPLLGRIISGIDAELTSPSRGSFDRTWWCWKFTDFSATRFQEGAYVLAWLASSPLSPAGVRDNARLVDLARAAIRFWTTLQHEDGSFDEAYPFERSLAATAFTCFYVGRAVERIRQHMPDAELTAALQTVERGASWLAANGEYHGILSNHLAAAAAALQVAGDLCGSDRHSAARDRYLGIIYREQHPTEGWMREYGGADPGYQSHGMFYLADIWRRTNDGELLDRLAQAARFLSWFVHPDGTIGGEYASRGTKFAYPAAFEILAPFVPEAASIAVHLRERIASQRGVGARQMDAWNQFPLTNNLMFAAEAAGPIVAAAPLPWRSPSARAEFPAAGLVVANTGHLVVAVGGRMGGALKVWSTDGRLRYEDCGYAVARGSFWTVSQGDSDYVSAVDKDGVVLDIAATFRKVPPIRFSPWRFVGFRIFTTTVGRAPVLARWLKDVLVAVLIRRKPAQPGRLRRRIVVGTDVITITDRIEATEGRPVANARHVPYHMGSARYADLEDWLGAAQPCPEPEGAPNGYTRVVEVRGSGYAET